MVIKFKLSYKKKRYNRGRFTEGLYWRFVSWLVGFEYEQQSETKSKNQMKSKNG